MLQEAAVYCGASVIIYYATVRQNNAFFQYVIYCSSVHLFVALCIFVSKNQYLYRK